MADNGYQTLIDMGLTPEQIQRFQNEGMSLDQIAQVMQMSQQQGEFDLLGEDVRYAENLTRTPMPRGYHTRAGFTASHPFEFIGAGLDRLRGQMRRQQAQEARQQALVELAKARAQGAGMASAPMTRPQVPTLPPSRRQAATAATMFPHLKNWRAFE